MVQATYDWVGYNCDCPAAQDAEEACLCDDGCECVCPECNCIAGGCACGGNCACGAEGIEEEDDTT